MVAPYQEEECVSVGGTCKFSSDCSGGSLVSGKCPTQGSDVKCCLACKFIVLGSNPDVNALVMV